MSEKLESIQGPILFWRPLEQGGINVSESEEFVPIVKIEYCNNWVLITWRCVGMNGFKSFAFACWGRSLSASGWMTTTENGCLQSDWSWVDPILLRSFARVHLRVWDRHRSWKHLSAFCRQSPQDRSVQPVHLHGKIALVIIWHATSFGVFFSMTSDCEATFPSIRVASQRMNYHKLVILVISLNSTPKTRDHASPLVKALLTSVRPLWDLLHVGQNGMYLVFFCWAPGM